MNTITLAQTTLIVSNLRTASFWAELDSAIQKLHGTVCIHSSNSRDYQLSTIEMRVFIAGSAVTVSWVSRTPVLDARSRIDLRQSADAWLDTLAALMLRPAPVAARVQAASALLAAGFDSVSVSTTGATSLPLEPMCQQAMAA